MPDDEQQYHRRVWFHRVGTDPATGHEIVARAGRYGPYVTEVLTAEEAELKGKAKEAVGDATGNEQWQAEGKKDQTVGSLKNAGEKVKDAFRD